MMIHYAILHACTMYYNVFQNKIIASYRPNNINEWVCFFVLFFLHSAIE